MPKRYSGLLLRAACGAAASLALGSVSYGQNVSAPVILQWFDGSYKTMEYRMADYFMAGYGGLWTPPPFRADSGNSSVGYDVYDRFDLGSNGNPTQYGTENGLKAMINATHQASGRVYLDLVWNHDGFSNWSTVDGNGNSFLNAGGYPGFYMGTGTNNNFGDFHDPSATGDENMQLSGLIDIDQSTNNQFIRNPVNAGDPANLPGGTVAAYGRLANVPTADNRRFYQDQSQGGIFVHDPLTGDSTIYDFGPTAATNGTPIQENATGYLMRNARWLIQDTGADGFRLDATKNYPNWVLNYFDKAVYKAITKPLLDGSRQWVWSFGENFDTNFDALNSRVRLDINSQPDNTVGGNRDTLDFPLYYAMQGNLSNNGLNNDWRNVVNASYDAADGYANDGSRGVAFVQSHDGSGSPPYLSNVAYAYTLLRPGNAIVYYNGNEFGTRGNNFPQQGREDALGGPGANNQYITTLVDIRNRYGRGNYQERWLDKETLVYERANNVIAAYNNRLDSGYDTRTVQTGFTPGMHLIELTGNATDPTVDPNNDIYDTVAVDGSGQITIRIPRNLNANGVEHDRGYVMYGPATPHGSLTLSNIASTIAPDSGAGTNGTARITPIHVIKSNNFTVTLQTTPMTLSDGWRDYDADGDNALLMMDGGIDLNNNGQVDFRSYTTQDTNYPNDPTHTVPSVTYGFENFTTTHTPGYNNTSTGYVGTYAQDIDTTKLSEGYHYLTVRAFRHRGDGGPAEWSDFKDVIYVDRFAPVSAVDSVVNKPFGGANDRRFNIKSVDETASTVYVLIDQPASKTDAQILASLSGNLATQTDRDIFARDLNSATTGNHVLTVVTQEIDGNYSIQRFPGQFTQTGVGSGLGDIDHNNSYNQFDVMAFSPILKSGNTQFNAAADFDGNGLVDLTDCFLYGPALEAAGANSTTMSQYQSLLHDSFVTTGTWTVPGATTTVNEVTSGTTIVPTAVTLSARSIVSNSLQIQSNAKVTIRPNGTSTGVSYINSLSIAPGGTLDLTDNDLVVNNGVFSDVQALVFAGYSNGVDPGKTGIISSTGQAATGNPILALFDNALVHSPDYPFGSGQTIGGNAVVGKYTYFGDTNLDGQVTADDYGALDANFGATNVPAGVAWLDGDTNFDGSVTADDYGALDANFGLGVGNPLTANAAQVAVPEPSSVLLLSLGSAALFARRTRRNKR